MSRLMDIGIDRISNMLLDMAKTLEETVGKAIDAYCQGKGLVKEIRENSDRLFLLQEEVSELAVELIARFQPVASDLRFIKSCVEIASGFNRLGRYAYDIAQIFDLFGDLSSCDNSRVIEMSKIVEDMIHISIQSFATRDVELAKTLREMDDKVDNLYVNYLKNILKKKPTDVKCPLAATLVLRYLERMADHACYIGDSVVYIVTGEKPFIR